MPMRLVIKDTLMLYTYINWKKATQIHVCAQLPTREYDNVRINVLDWKIDNGIVALSYQNRNDAYAPIYDVKLPVVLEEVKLEKPSKSRFWKLDEFWRGWVNSKTGEQVRID
jgi:hypothetical protein